MPVSRHNLHGNICPNININYNDKFNEQSYNYCVYYLPVCNTDILAVPNLFSWQVKLFIYKKNCHEQTNRGT